MFNSMSVLTATVYFHLYVLSNIYTDHFQCISYTGITTKSNSIVSFSIVLTFPFCKIPCFIQVTITNLDLNIYFFDDFLFELLNIVYRLKIWERVTLIIQITIRLITDCSHPKICLEDMWKIGTGNCKPTDVMN